jgi:hypothetical protein
MGTLSLLVIGACFVTILFCLYMLARNQWVFRQVMRFHAEAFERPAPQWFALGCPTSDDLCESYSAMLRRFWIWDREKFRKRRLPQPSEDTPSG